MQTFVFSIFDTKAKLYGQPFFSKNKETAIREFQVAVHGDGMMGKYPEDFTLYSVGRFKFETGEIIPQAPESITQGIHLVDAPPIQPSFEMTNGGTQWPSPPREMQEAAESTLNQLQKDNDALRAHTGLPMSDTLDTTPTNTGGSNR